MTEQELVPAYLRFKAYSPYASFSTEAHSKKAPYNICRADGTPILDEDIGITKNTNFKAYGLLVYRYLADNYFNHDPSDVELEQYLVGIHNDLYEYAENERRRIRDGVYCGFTCFEDGKSVGGSSIYEVGSKDVERLAVEKAFFENIYGSNVVFKDTTREDILSSHKINMLDLIEEGVYLPNDLSLYDRVDVSGFLKIRFDPTAVRDRIVLCVFCLERLDQVAMAAKNGGEGIVDAAMAFQRLCDWSPIGSKIDDELIAREALSAQGRSAAFARHAKSSHKLKEFAISEFRVVENWKSTMDASKIIFSSVQDYAAENDIARLSEERGPKTVYDWLLKSLNNK